MKEQDKRYIYDEIQRQINSYDSWKPQVINCPTCTHMTIGVKTYFGEQYGTVCTTCGGVFTEGLVKIGLSKTKK